MKTLKKLALVAVLALYGASSMFAMNDAERLALRQIKDYLSSQRLKTQMEDDALYFEEDDVLYWITCDGNASMMKFVLHRENLQYIGEKEYNNKTIVNRKNENATRAAGLATAHNDYKVYIKGNKARFEYPMFATSTTEYIKVLPYVLRSFSKANDSFKNCYKVAKQYNDSVHKFWMGNDTSKMVLAQNLVTSKAKDNKNNKVLSMNKIEIRNINNNGTVITDYNTGLRKSQTRFVQPKVYVNANKKGSYRLGVKIYTPAGKLLVPSQDADYTVINMIDVEKPNKVEEFELTQFGTDNPDFWKAGEYKIEFFDDGRCIHKDSFTIL